MGASVINASVSAKGEPPQSAIHRNIAIEDNTFRVFDKWLLNARGVNSVRFTGHTIEKTNAYPPYQDVKAPITAGYVENLVVKDNTFAGSTFDRLVQMDDATRKSVTISQ